MLTANVHNTSFAPKEMFRFNAKFEINTEPFDL